MKRNVKKEVYRVAVRVLTAECYSVVTADEYLAADETIARHLARSEAETKLRFGDKVREVWIVE